MERPAKGAPTALSVITGSTVTLTATSDAPTGSQATLAYGFDPNGFRHSRTLNGTITHRYLLGGLIETDAAGALSSYDVDGPLGDLAHYSAPPSTGQTAVSFTYTNAHGDLAAETTLAGVRSAAYHYDPFGALLETTPATPTNTTTERYTGQWDKKHDTTSNLIEMGARPYDPSLGRFYAIDPIEGGSANHYDYGAQDPVNAYDLDGTCLCLEKRAQQLKRIAVSGYDKTLQILQEAPYGVYYVSFTVLDQANRHKVPVPLVLRAGLVGGQAIGLAGDAAIDKARGKSMWDDARRDSALPNFVAKRWNPDVLYGYLPGMGYDSHGNKKIDFRF